ncbi:MAG TPA: PAS domain-containing protein [Alphaproteobacteria bacterium]|nr:PAS domain-containing protein [Alphaproteobacteria bacterium]
MAEKFSLTGVERHFAPDEVIVTKTDLRGRITYANRTFLKIAGLSEAEALDAPHSVIRHPDMPRCVFKALWDTIGAGREIFAWVVNRASNGDHYWVFAHVTPSFDSGGRIVGYHSSRRVADPKVVSEHIVPLYRTLLAEERRFENRKEGMAAGSALLTKLLREKGLDYERLVFALA